MRIAFVTDTYEDSISGGVITGVRFVEALRRRHHAVTVVATGLPAPGKVLIPGFQVPIRAMRENRFTFGWPSRDTLERVFAAVDVVHINFPFPLGFGALRIARRMGVPTVAAFHVQPENLLRSVGVRSPRLASCLYRFWVRSFFQRADGVVGPSRFAVERLRQYGLTARAWVVSNGAPPCPVRPQSDARFWHPPHPVLCIGRLAAEKRQDVIIDAVARCRHRDRIRLVMAGAGPLERQLHARARQRGLDVEIGWVSDQRLAELRAEAHLFVHASEVELEGMAVLEAMAAGLPVLIADAPDSAAPGLASGPEFLFRPGDASDLAQHLDMLLDAPALLAAASRRSLRRAALYTFDHSVQRLEHVYETLVARSVVSPASLAVTGATARGAA